jgi:hypothetical protein
MTTIIKTPEADLVDMSCDLAITVNEIIINSDESMLDAGNALLEIKAMRKKVGEYFDPVIKSAYQTHKQLNTKKREVESPLISAESRLKRGMADYHAEQERARKAEEARLAEIARKQEEDRRLNAAEEAEAAGDGEAAVAILEEQPVHVPTPVVPAAPRQEGIQFKENWKAECEDLMLLVKAIADGKAPLAAVKADMVMLNRQAVTFKGKINYPGVRFYSEKVVAAKAS